VDEIVVPEDGEDVVGYVSDDDAGTAAEAAWIRAVGRMPTFDHSPFEHQAMTILHEVTLMCLMKRKRSAMREQSTLHPATSMVDEREPAAAALKKATQAVT